VEPPGPAWLRRLLGDDFFVNVVSVWVGTDAEMEYLKHLDHLDVLLIGDPSVALNGQGYVAPNPEATDAGMANLKTLTRLRRLAILGTKVTDAGLKNLVELKQLQTLNLTGIRVTDGGLESLKSLNQLRALHLGISTITDAGLEHLKGLQQLRYLDVSHTAVTDDGVQKLQQALPNCEIRR
jgi:internalin A